MNSHDIPPFKWGPDFWAMFHIYAISYPEIPYPIDISIAEDFIKMIPFILPCVTCSDHADSFIRQYVKFDHSLRGVVSSRRALFTFFLDFHNSVNHRLDKSIVKFTHIRRLWSLKSYTPSQWGPHYWFVYHLYAATYPNNPSPIVQSVAKRFIKSIPFTVPEFRDSILTFIRQYTNSDPELNRVVESRAELFGFFHAFHNSVNYRLDKPQITLSEAKTKWNFKESI